MFITTARVTRQDLTFKNNSILCLSRLNNVSNVILNYYSRFFRILPLLLHALRWHSIWHIGLQARKLLYCDRHGIYNFISMALELQWFAWDFTGSSHLAFPNGANILCGNSETITSYTTLQEFSAYISWKSKNNMWACNEETASTARILYWRSVSSNSFGNLVLYLYANFGTIFSLLIHWFK